jgi:hypothetical protein
MRSLYLCVQRGNSAPVHKKEDAKNHMSMVILNEDNRVSYVRDVDRWSSWWADQENRRRATVAVTEVGNRVAILTVLAPVAEEKSPFVSSVHGGIYDGHKRWYRTREQALQGHSEIVRMCCP